MPQSILAESWKFHMWILIFIRESIISHVKYIRSPFEIWNFELGNFTCKLGISYEKTFTFHMWNESFISENVAIPYIFHMWKDTRNLCKGIAKIQSELEVANILVPMWLNIHRCNRKLIVLILLTYYRKNDENSKCNLTSQSNSSICRQHFFSCKRDVKPSVSLNFNIDDTAKYFQKSGRFVDGLTTN